MTTPQDALMAQLDGACRDLALVVERVRNIVPPAGTLPHHETTDDATRGGDHDYALAVDHLHELAGLVAGAVEALPEMRFKVDVERADACVREYLELFQRSHSLRAGVSLEAHLRPGIIPADVSAGTLQDCLEFYSDEQPRTSK